MSKEKSRNPRIDPYDLNTLSNRSIKTSIPNLASKRSLDIFSAGGKNSTVTQNIIKSKDLKR